ncbi:hypothetical protein IX53_05475 [Kosmotoga pacifica]|uniref:ABC transporter permease n=1 Tax=Kosmotoga pacifica TaxID=1330330 RepID=A0A0G2ZCS7_9BACT|nr:hypothetical protein IX53_05475 [Kosmotoga pacifica]
MAIARNAFLRNRIYLLNHLISNAGSFVFGYIFVSIWRAILGDSPEASLMVTYVMVNQAGLWITMFLPYGAFLFQKVRDGTIAFELLRPYGIIYLSFYEVLGHVVYNFLFRYLPIFFLGFLLLGVKLPSPGQIAPYGISILMAFIISFFLNYFIGLWSLRFLSISGAQSLYYFLMNFLSGYMLPAEYYPGILKKIMPLTPFAATNYVPGSIYLGKMTFLEGIKLQLSWIMILLLLALVLTKLTQKRLQIQGG